MDTRQGPPDFAALAQRVDGAYGWNDLVLPAEKLGVLREICTRVRQRSAAQGITVLLSGPPGAGKTRSAIVMARELGRELYRVDLPRVVSKYVGETEKNLARVFEHAENLGAILFFDEADALFGKRTDVKDSHDRFANLEMATLLQHLERYRGLTVLSTNLEHPIDDDVRRRLAFIVTLGTPKAPEPPPKKLAQ